jgi:hypothetical protein
MWPCDRKMQGLPCAATGAAKPDGNARSMAEQSPNPEAPRQRIGGAIREVSHRDPARVDRKGRKRLGQAKIDRRNVGPVAPTDHVPGGVSRVRDEHQNAAALRTRADALPRSLSHNQ